MIADWQTEDGLKAIEIMAPLEYGYVTSHQALCILRNAAVEWLHTLHKDIRLEWNEDELLIETWEEDIDEYVEGVFAPDYDAALIAAVLASKEEEA